MPFVTTTGEQTFPFVQFTEPPSYDLWRVAEIESGQWSFAPGSVKFLPTRVNIVFEEARNYVDAIVNSGQYLEAYLAANLEARINPQASARMEFDLDRLEAHHSSALKNIRAFRSPALLFAEVVKTSEQMPPDMLPQVTIRIAPSPPEEEGPSTLGYWRSVRESLRNAFSLNLETLAAVVGVAYATFANLGKTRPKDPTVAKVLRLHELVRALREKDPQTADDWLHADGSYILRDHGLDVFASTIERRIFGDTRMLRPSIVIDEEPDYDIGGYPPAERPPRSGKRI